MLTQLTVTIPFQIQSRRVRNASGVSWSRIAAALYPALKRCLDLVIALVVLALVGPFMLLIALAIRLDSPGPALIVQKRAGQNGRTFDFYKFRSMTHSPEHMEAHRKFAEAYIAGKMPPPGQESDYTLYKVPANSRNITRVGRWLRRTSLDELPQLFNIIRGDMSLVGPRPYMACEVALFSDRQRQRLAALPGITGWAQINGRSSLTFDKIVTLDLQYIRGAPPP